MQIRDLTNFEELTVPEAANVTGGKKKKKSFNLGSMQASCITEHWGTPPLPPLLAPFIP